MQRTIKNILLVYPSAYPENPRADAEFERAMQVPFSLLSIGTYLDDQGYNVKIIDARLHPKKEFAELVKSLLPKMDAVGFSVMTCHVRHGRKIAQLIRKLRPEIPLIWGGIHITLYPEQAAADECVDFAVDGEGEFALRDLLEFLKNPENPPKPLSEIPALVYQENGTIRHNPIDVPVDVNKVPDPNYDLLEVERYLNFRAAHYSKERWVRSLDLYTSRGCPYKCTFCYTALPSFDKYRAWSAERTLHIIDNLKKKYDVEYLQFTDDFFFGDLPRVKAVFDGLIARDYRIGWQTSIRANNFNPRQVNDELLAKMKEAGCHILIMGVESGSPRVRTMLKKGIQESHIINAFSQCYKYDIIPYGLFMGGLPTETPEELQETIDMYGKILDVSPDAVLSAPAVFTPYPGCEIYKMCVEMGFQEPKSFKEWADYNFDYGLGLRANAHSLPWVRDPQFLVNLESWIFWYIYYRNRKFNRMSMSHARRVFGRIAQFRYDHKFWKFDYDVRLVKMGRRLRDRVAVQENGIYRVKFKHIKPSAQQVTPAGMLAQ